MSTLPPAVAQAIEWYALQGCGTFTPEARQRLQHWLESDPSHAEAWQTLHHQLSRNLAPLARQPAARQALSDSGRGRRALLRGALGLGTLALGSHLLTRDGGPLHEYWGADLSTTTAERRRFQLEDGSSLLLNAQSAVDLQYSSTQRRIALLRGDVRVQARAERARPFVIHCPRGEIWMSEGQCLLSLQSASAQLWALEGDMHLRADGTSLQLQPGQGLGFDGQRWQPLPAAYIDQRAWVSGLLEVHDQPLAAVINALRPYHHGLLQISSRAASLRISGVFSLDDSALALAALADVLPLRIDRYLGWWTRIERV